MNNVTKASEERKRFRKYLKETLESGLKKEVSDSEIEESKEHIKTMKEAFERAHFVSRESMQRQFTV